MAAETLMFGLGAGASMLFNKKSDQPAAPMPTPTIQLPDPTPPPRAPLSPALTAASQRARAQTGGAMGNSDIVLTSSASRSSETPVSRTTLLGGP